MTKNSAIGVFQPLLQPYFPEWKNTIVLPETNVQRGRYIFKVSLDKIWRRIAIASHATLDELAMIILRSINFDDDHLYEFSYRGSNGRRYRIGHPFLETGRSTDKTTVADLLLAIGQTMIFLFDFGDYWEFDVTLEQIDPNQAVKKATVLEEKGQAPVQYPDYDNGGSINL